MDHFEQHALTAEPTTVVETLPEAPISGVAYLFKLVGKSQAPAAQLNFHAE